ncbi:MAG: hypothetical protein GY841_02865 [FCB group bacterium]|nr:hypothetical protein [FCB group bacterium]
MKINITDEHIVPNMGEHWNKPIEWIDGDDVNWMLGTLCGRRDDGKPYQWYIMNENGGYQMADKVRVENPDYITPELRRIIDKAFINNSKPFNRFSEASQNYFNHILDTEPERCFVRETYEWFPCSGPSMASNDTVVVRLGEPQGPVESSEPAYRDLDIYVSFGRYYFKDPVEFVQIASNAINYEAFLGYVSPTGTIEMYWSPDMDETWKVRVKI